MLREERDILKRARLPSPRRPGERVSVHRSGEGGAAQRQAGVRAARGLPRRLLRLGAYVPSPRQRQDELLEEVKGVHEGNRGTYGSPRVHAQLRKDGEVCGRNRVARLMRANGIVGRARRRFKRTTIPDPDATAGAADLVKRVFGPATIEVDRLWCGDISFVRTWEGWMCTSQP